MSLLFMFQTCAFYGYLVYSVKHLMSFMVYVSAGKLLTTIDVYCFYMKTLKDIFKNSICLLKFITLIYIFIYSIHQFCFLLLFCHREIEWIFKKNIYKTHVIGFDFQSKDM